MTSLHRIGIHAGLGFHVPFQERIHLFHDAGFDTISLWWEERHERARELRHLAPDMIRNTGLYIDNIHVPYYCCNDLWSEDSVTRKYALDLHLSWIDDAARHHIPIMVMHVTMGIKPSPPTSTGLDSFQALTDHAENQGVVLAIENTRSDAHVAWLLDQIPSPALGLCFDTSHSHLWGDDPLHLLSRYGSRLITTHLSDTDGKRDQHWVPGRGVVAFDQVAHQLNSLQYTGTILLEITHREENGDFKTFLLDARNKASEIAQSIYTQNTNDEREISNG
ncbi:MAG: sugar phosphate isomerase [Candidatus Hydrogenedentota bacterium]|nr:MAG: sugar phosphate isomerase [Candidatus Hydrogenedentota bacterium]